MQQRVRAAIVLQGDAVRAEERALGVDRLGIPRLEGRGQDRGHDDGEAMFGPGANAHEARDHDDHEGVGRQRRNGGCLSGDRQPVGAE